MAKFTFQNGNVVVVENYNIGKLLPAKIPSLKRASIIALKSIKEGNTEDCGVLKVVSNGDLKDVYFKNNAILTVPSAYNIIGYAQALDVVIKEID